MTICAHIITRNILYQLLELLLVTRLLALAQGRHGRGSATNLRPV